MPISSDGTVLHRYGSTRYCDNKEEVVRYVNEVLSLFPEDRTLTMTIKPVKYAESYAVTVIIEWSEDTATRSCSEERQTT